MKFYEILMKKLWNEIHEELQTKSLASGIEGIFLYVLVRLTTHPLDILFDKNYLNELYDIAKNNSKKRMKKNMFF